jgi:hypothetical protein
MTKADLSFRPSCWCEHSLHGRHLQSSIGQSGFSAISASQTCGFWGPPYQYMRNGVDDVMKKVLFCLVSMSMAMWSTQSRGADDDYFDDADTASVIDVWHEVNSRCRDSSSDMTMAWCGVRGLVGTYLKTEREQCFGKQGQAEMDMDWHSCGQDSLRN